MCLLRLSCGGVEDGEGVARLAGFFTFAEFKFAACFICEDVATVLFQAFAHGVVG